MTQYVICYDISNPRRLGQIHRYLKKRAWALQYSVFLFDGTPHQLEACLADLASLMDAAADDIRAYPLPARGLRWCIGPSTLPEDIHAEALPAPWQSHVII